MSIATEIERINTAKLDVKSAIEEKGVTIPEDTLLSDFPNYIKQIPTGEAITEPYAIYRGLSGAKYTECETFNMVSVPENFIRQNSGVQKVIINEGVTILRNAAIYYCANLTEVSLPSTLKSLNANSLGYNTKLDNITLPKSMESVNVMAFVNCPGLTKFTIEEGYNIHLPLGYCSSLSQESVSGIITNYISGLQRTLTLHADVFAAVPEEEIARANAKGLTIAQA